MKNSSEEKCEAHVCASIGAPSCYKCFVYIKKQKDKKLN